MERISNIYQDNQFRKIINHNSLNLDRTRNQILTQKKIASPHEAPFKTQVIMHHDNKIKDFYRYKENIENSITYLSFVEKQLDHILNILQKLREVVIAGSNGVLSSTEHVLAFKEVYQYLDEIIQIANRSFQGQNIFAGFQSQKKPFEVSLTKAKESNDPLFESVQYQGDSGKIYREIDKGNFIVINFPATEIFWTSKLRIISQVPATDYLATSQNLESPYQEIKINNVKIRIQDGDHLNKIVDKINASNAPVTAYIDNTENNHFLVLQGHYPHRLILEDVDGGTVLQDLGIIERASYPSKKFSTKAIIEGENLFQDLIQLQNAFLEHSFDQINAKIGKIDMAIDHIAQQRSVLGLKQQRIEKVKTLMEKNIIDLKNSYHEINGVNLEEEIPKLKNEELNYQVSLKLRAQLNQFSLFDFVK